MTIRLKTDIKNLKLKQKPVLISTFIRSTQPDISPASELLFRIHREANASKKENERI